MIAEVVILAGLAGAAIPVGAAVGYLDQTHREKQHEDLHHAVIAFGGGVLLAAVALVLVPGGEHEVGVVGLVVAFGGGAVLVLLIDRAIERRGGAASNALAMVMDFVPEAIALGAVLGSGAPGGALLALLIGLQNLPEGFNSFRELCGAGIGRGPALAMLAPLALLGPAAAVAGFWLLADQPVLLAYLFLAAAGAIVYLIFHDLAPQALRRGHWLPTMGAVAGFLVGLVGEALLVD